MPDYRPPPSFDSLVREIDGLIEREHATRTALTVSLAELHGEPAVQKPEVHGLLAEMKVSSFTQLLDAYRRAGFRLQDAVDGGAGAGAMSTKMLACLEGSVYAFEPFPGNHRFFSSIDERVRLLPFALGESRRFMSFRVSSVVSEDSVWGKRGMAGYSSVGKLAAGEHESGDLQVQCVRGDDEIPSDARIDFIKLDLQGGELNALKGMERLLPQVAFMWVEFMGSMELLDYVKARGFVIFDTEYLFHGSPADDVHRAFDVLENDLALSTGATAWTGFKRTSWTNFRREFAHYKETLSLGQTDLVCVNRSRLAEFNRAVQCM